MSSDCDSPVGYVVDTRQADGECRIILHGEIDMAVRPALDTAIANALAQESTLVFDLTDVTFLDSTGLAAIARGVADHSPVRVLHPRPLIRRALEVSGVDRYIEIVDGDASTPES